MIRVATELSKMNHEVTIFSPTSPTFYSIPENINLSFTVHSSSKSKVNSPLQKMRTLLNLANTITRGQDILHTFDEFASLSAFLLRESKKTRASLYATIHDINRIEWGLSKKIGGQLGIECCKHFVGVICVCNFWKNQLIKIDDFIPEKVHIAHNGIDASFFSIRNNVCDKDKIILYTAGFYQSKGVEYIIRALPLIKKIWKNVDLIISGGYNRKFYKRMLKLASRLKVKKSIQYIGRVTEEKLLQLYESVDIVILASVMTEGWGLTLAEAMAAHKPVIGTNHGGIPELIGASGILVPPKNVKAIAEAVITYIKDDDFRERMIKSGFERSKLFTWKNTALSYSKAYDLNK